ncbi:B12-binding domain-containing radical SAM protein [bacterium]|nr:B12-binding domain-containing radical SAM protein [bacterium]
MANKEITLFYPLINETPSYPPLGLLAISAPLLENGYQVNIINANIEDNFEERLLALSKKSLCLGISLILGNQVKSGYRVTCLIKKHLPNLPIVWGGWFPTLMYEQILQDKKIDFIIRGQGELAFLELVKSLENKEDFKKIPSLVYKKGQEIKVNEIQFIKDIKPINRKAYDLIPVERHIQKSFDGQSRILGYVSSIGCYGRCAFCCVPLTFGRNRYYALKAEQVVDDLKYLVSRFKVNRINILDFNFFIHRRRAKEILKSICEEGLNITWEANIRVDQVLHLDEELLLYMKKSGLDLLYLGAESGSNKILDLIQKDITFSDIERCNAILKKYDIRPSYSFIVGMMKEDGFKDLEKTFDLVLRLKNIHPNCLISIHHYSPWPGTYGFEMAKEHGFKPPLNLLEWTKFKTEEVVVPWTNLRYEMKVVRFFQYYLEILYPPFSTLKLVKKFKLEFVYNFLKLTTSLRIKYKFYYLDLIWGLILIYKLLKKCYKKIKYYFLFRGYHESC